MKQIIIVFALLLSYIQLYAQISKEPDVRNHELLELYNCDYSINSNLKKEFKPARTGIAFFKSIPGSVMSNEDIEVYLEVEPYYYREWKHGHPLHWYRIVIKNKSGRDLYIDRSKCWRIPSEGPSFCYYTEKYSHITNKILCIKANETTQLVQSKLKLYYGYEEMVDDYNLGCIPYFNTDIYGDGTEEFGGIKNRVGMCYRFYYGKLNVGDEEHFDYDNSPFCVNYNIIYSDNNNFENSYRLDFGFYVSNICGLESGGIQLYGRVRSSTKKWMSGCKDNYSTNIEGYTNKTLVAPVGFYNDVRDNKKIDEIVTTADQLLQVGNYSKACKLYNKALKSGYNTSGVFYYNAGIANYYAGKNAYYSREYLERVCEYDDLDSIYTGYIPALIKNINSSIEERNARINQLMNDLTNSLSNLSSSLTTSLSANPNHAPIAVQNVRQNNAVATQRSSSIKRTQNDNIDNEDIDIRDIKIKCHECGGSGKCRPSGSVEARTTRCGGSGKCPMCNGKGKSSTKCAKCKGKGCSKCDDTGYLDCTDCDGSGDCPHCSGTGKCPRCNGTGKE